MADSWYSKFTGAAGQGKDYAFQNPGTTALYITTGVAFVVASAPMVVAGPCLTAVGFTSNGVAAASAAAGWQASLGSVVAPSLFATLQSAGAGGYGVAAVSSAVGLPAGATAFATGTAAAWRTWRSRNEPRGDDTDDNMGDGSESSNEADTRVKKAEDGDEHEHEHEHEEEEEEEEGETN